MRNILTISFLLLVLVQCSKTGPRAKNVSYDITKTTVDKAAVKSVVKKPGSSFQNILIITESCALFYKPDSIQKERIKAVTDPQVFASGMHDFFYLQKYAHRFLKEHWSGLKIIEVQNVRFLVFIKKDRSPEILDLDKLDDSYGLVLFNKVRSPLQVDMANIETLVPEYFKTVRTSNVHPKK